MFLLNPHHPFEGVQGDIKKPDYKNNPVKKNERLELLKRVT